MERRIKELHDILHGKSKKRVYLFGASVTGRKVYVQMAKYNKECIKAFVDNNPILQGTELEGVPIINKVQLQKEYKKNDLILITSNKFVPIAKDLEKLGVTNYVKCDALFVDYCFQYNESNRVNKQPWERALNWLLNNIIDGEGVRATSSHEHAYPEVTGYIIPTLVQYGYYEEAKTAVRWLLSLQKENGGFCGIEGTKDENREYIFDSGQILRGFLALKDDDELHDILINAIDNVSNYLVSCMIDGGDGGYIIQYEEGSFAVEPILIYTLAPLKQAAKYRNNNEWDKAADNCLAFYMKHKDFLREETLTHFLAYQVEALIELQKTNIIADIMQYFEDTFNEKGYIPGYKGALWTCSTGNAQIALCCYLIGKHELGNHLMEQLEKMQMATGGFLGSYGENPEYFPVTEISWANKYFLDANRLRIQEWFNDNAEIFPVDITEEHAEFQAVLKYVKDNMKIAEIGCGKGRFLKLLNEKKDNLDLTGVDISKEMIACLPQYISGKIGTLEHIPLKDNMYDMVLCIEAIEHSINTEIAVKELARILKPNGILIIIDKNVEHWGRLECPSWENWFEKDKMISLIKKYCRSVECQSINMYGEENDNMFLMWIGRK